MPSITPAERRQNLRTALVLASIVAAFFLGVVVKFWLYGTG